MAENNTRRIKSSTMMNSMNCLMLFLVNRRLPCVKLRENGKPVVDTQPKQQSKQNKALDEVNVYDQTTGIPSVEELLKQKIEQSEIPKADSAQERQLF